MNYLSQHGSTKTTPQSEAMRPEQVENSAGGFVFTLDPLDHCRRFLILGAEGGTFYVGERDFVRSNMAAFAKVLADGKGTDLVDLIADVSHAGRAKSNDPALFALAYVSVHGDLATRQAAYAALPKVARIGTHLFHFLDYREGFGGWTRGLRRAVSAWYLDRSLASLANQLIKYRQRDGWSHRDVLRLAHVKPDSPGRDLLFKFAVSGEFDPTVGLIDPEESDGLEKIRGFINAQAAETPAWTADAVRRFALPREALKPDHLDSPEVWEALLYGMPVEAMLRNLATMSRNGTIKPLSEAEKTIAEALVDGERLVNGRLHPLSILNARAIYSQGGANPYGYSQGGSYPVSDTIVGALDKSFHLAFGNVEPAGKRFLLGLDVSGSMGSLIGGGAGGLTCRDATAAMALVTAATEPQTHAIAFTSGGETIDFDNGGGMYRRGGVTPFPISGEDSLGGVVQQMNALQYGGTDCALPMLYALLNGIEADVFVVYTDNETWAGSIHPAQALEKYRRETGIEAKLVVVGMTSTEFTIANPADPGMLDVVGFDTATPNLISAFARGEL